MSPATPPDGWRERADRAVRRGQQLDRFIPAFLLDSPVSRAGYLYATDDTVPASVLRHEAIHRRQWQRYGMLMPLMYAIAGRDPLRNRFEIEAGLEDGRYVPRQRASKP